MNIEALIKRAFLLLEDSDYFKASEIFDQVLNENPEDAMAYVGLLCVELKLQNERELANCQTPIADLNNFKKAVRFGDASIITRLHEYNTTIVNRINKESKERAYKVVVDELNTIQNMLDNTQEQCLTKSEAFIDIARRFRVVGDYKDSLVRADECDKNVVFYQELSEQRKEENFTKKKALKKTETKK